MGGGAQQLRAAPPPEPSSWVRGSPARSGGGGRIAARSLLGGTEQGCSKDESGGARLDKSRTRRAGRASRRRYPYLRSLTRAVLSSRPSGPALLPRVTSPETHRRGLEGRTRTSAR
jgi:hypothetical protein